MRIIVRIILRILEAIVVFALCCLCFFAAKPDYFTTEEQKKVKRTSETPPVRVVTRSVQFLANDRVFQATGTSIARKSVWIYSPVAAQVTSVNFTAQKRVKKGALLLQLDDREERLALQLAKVELQNAEKVLTRYRRTIGGRAVSANEIDAARLGFDAAKVRLEQAKFAVSERKIIAPFTGVVGISRVDLGDRIATNTIITSLDDRSGIYVDFQVPELLAGSLSPNLKAEMTTPAFPGKTFIGTITDVESRFDVQTRTVRIRVSIDNSNDMLRPGMSFAIKLHLKGKIFPAVPEISLKWGREGAYVWLIKNSKAQKTTARVVARTNQQVLVDAQIEEGDIVVIEGTQRLREGREVVNDSEKEQEYNGPTR
ncbi:efflux RND transporter periplasmic adaptor subunit [Candidatus Uabimicrobium amorphum]|uniref:MexH family multidrug efflux RND transporter periplasmic adaptor subunit n=1 Tax=Uabimicrobium amorphum TaxID=2596890 RepID=A0A5S9IP22_UABAM|nr:efflux RND transporter periplasmic adaptor subunit [Candidatus Uabimicrobium amorphum]BBM85067.1 MexH family multidrug efflux RND transporter periplasmic adaptor subunit [Candidatus Uabimicrobium amorphum]